MNNEKIDEDILEEILSSANYYNDSENPSQFYVEYEKEPKVWYFEPLDSYMFKAYVGYIYRNQTGQNVIPSIDYSLAIRKQDLLMTGCSSVEVQRRLAGSIEEECILYFLADEKRRIIKVTPDDMKVTSRLKNQSIRFMKYPLDREQVMPVKSEKNLFELLRPYVNLKEDSFKLFVITLVQYFSRSSSHFAMVLSSSKGTGKSTLSRLIRRLVEPSDAEITLTSNSESDLKTTLAGNYVVCYDNTDTLSVTFSNILCAAITGSRDVKRKLYTDFDQVVLKLQNVVIINGVDIVPFKSDLVERSLLFTLEKITAKKRKTDSDFWTAFEKDRPYILGAIFETLMKAMQVYPSLKNITGLHRMASANREMIAIAQVLGISMTDFQELLAKNNDEMQQAYTQYNPFVDTVVDFVLGSIHSKIDMRATKLYEKIYSSIPASKNFFPKSASAFSRKLSEESDALAREGITIFKYKKANGNYIRLEKIAQSQMTKEQKKNAEKHTAKDPMLCDDQEEDFDNQDEA